MQGEVAEAINNNFRSPNVSDSNGEPANLVDTTNAIAAALQQIADADLALRTQAIAGALQQIADSIERLAGVLERTGRDRIDG